MLRATPYTPVFPPSLRMPESRASISCDSNVTVNEDCSKKPYIDYLKERYILLASVPQGELCPPSRQASPESENRIEALRLRMRKARELRFPHDPVFTLVCTGVRGGDWASKSEQEDENSDRHYILPDTEEEWFQWEQKQKAARERRKAERKAAEDRQKTAKWSEEIKDNSPGRPLPEDVVSSQARRQREDGSSGLGFPVIKNTAAAATKEKATSHYFIHHSPPPGGSHTDDCDPVERMSSPMPPAPALDPLPDFADSFSMPSSPPLLPQLHPDAPFPDDLRQSPTFVLKDVCTSTPHKRDPIPDSVFQLSSPVSPPRCLPPLTASRTVSSLATKRPPEVATDEPSTPHAIKKARTIAEPSTPHAQTMVEPITPASAPRPTCSQEQSNLPNLKRLPTLSALLASSRKTSRGRSRITETPRRDALAAPEFSPSQPTYSMFRPQFQSTQRQARARSLPASPTQPISSQKSLAEPTSSSGIGFYQSQFNVEGKIHEVEAFLNADVWDVET